MRVDKRSVGIIGCGQIAISRHIPAWRKNHKVNLQAVSDVNLDRAKKTAKAFHIKSYYSDYREMLEKEKGLDIVDICTPTMTHYDIIAEAARQKKHIVVEKPITHSSKNCREIIEIAKKNDVKLTVCHTQRFYPTMIALKKLIDAGDLGRIARLDFAVPYYDLQPWVSSQGGALWECATHLIYQTLYLMGEVTQTRVLAYSKEKPQENLDIILYAQKGVVTIHLMKAAGAARMEIYGDKGKVVYPVWAFDSAVLEKHVKSWEALYRQQLMNNIRMIIQQSKKCITYVLGKADTTPHYILFTEFVNAINYSKDVPVPPEEGLRTVEILEEIEQLMPPTIVELNGKYSLDP